MNFVLSPSVVNQVCKHISYIRKFKKACLLVGMSDLPLRGTNEQLKSFAIKIEMLKIQLRKTMC